MIDSMHDILTRRILILDGAMGTMIQQYGLGESDFRGERFAGHAMPLCGDNDVLVLTRPDVIAAIHRAYREAGADILETCTFNANRLSQRRYGLEDCVHEMNLAAVRIAREAAAGGFVVGSVGPTGTSLSIAPDVERPEYREVDFDGMVEVYDEQIDALLEGGVDGLLLETVFDALTAKAALYAAETVFDRRRCRVPVLVSASVADCAGRLLCGQQIEAFAIAMAPYRPLALGLNCSFGVREMADVLPRLVAAAPPDVAIVCYPNAGLPDAEGHYHDDAHRMADALSDFARHGWLNIAGGCCGTTPDHIRAIATALRDLPPRSLCATETPIPTRFSGLEPLELRSALPSSLTSPLGFQLPPKQEKGSKGLRPLAGSGAAPQILIAERANVTGSKRFRRLVAERKWDEAVETAREQMKAGAKLVDICMDDVMIDSVAMMRAFLRRLAAEPEVSRYPVVIDSSDFAVIRVGLRECPGRCLVNSISLKPGEAVFLAQAREIQRLGAAAIVMAFDERGQATTTERRVEVLTRAVGLLLDRLDFAPSDIAVDPNILAIGTGIEEHAGQAVSFLETCRILRKRFPGLQTIGGLSNLSFSFRGRDDVRAAIHRAFLDEAGADLTMAIANPAAVSVQVADDLYALARALVRAEDGALEAMLDWMHSHAPGGKAVAEATDALAALPPERRLHEALLRGIPRYIEADMEALLSRMAPIAIVEGPLMDAMHDIGERFGRGEMFLPQIVRAARLMKQAIGVLPSEPTAQSTSRRILLATVWGDVHDIGKNIVGIVLRCNGYDVIDLGVMVDRERIVAAAREHGVDAIGLSGLISPSLAEMVRVAEAIKAAGICVPLFVGGAAASEAHAACKVEPAYWPGMVCYTADASRVPERIHAMLSPATAESTRAEIARRYAEIREGLAEPRVALRPLSESRRLAPRWDATPELRESLRAACARGLCAYAWSAAELEERLAWPRIERILGPEARSVCHRVIEESSADCLRTRAHLRFVHAEPDGDDIALFDDKGARIGTIFGFRVQEEGRDPVALSDFAVGGAVALFALTTPTPEGADPVHETIATALVDAAADVLQETHIASLGHCVCPACGYPITPDHSQKEIVLSLCRADELGICLTESWMMRPLASVCGFAIVHPEVEYFRLGAIGEDQWEDYARRRQIDDIITRCGA